MPPVFDYGWPELIHDAAPWLTVPVIFALWWLAGKLNSYAPTVSR